MQLISIFIAILCFDSWNKLQLHTVVTPMFDFLARVLLLGPIIEVGYFGDRNRGNKLSLAIVLTFYVVVKLFFYRLQVA